jgi:hypothetical protein
LASESNDHIVQCAWANNHEFRNNRIEALRMCISADACGHSLAMALTNGIQSWMLNTPPPDPEQLLQDEETRLLHAACELQQAIGWDHFFRVRITPLWSQCRANNASVSHQTWENRLARWIWQTVIGAWADRNKTLFGDSPLEANNVLRSRLEPRIREIYLEFEGLPPSIKLKYITKPVDALLKAHPDYLTVWTTQATQTLQVHRKALTRGQHLQPITRYFPRIPMNG